MNASQRKRRITFNRRTEVLLRRRLAISLENETWEQMYAVGREFGSPDFDRLTEEDYRRRAGAFDPALVVAVNARHVGLLKGKRSVHATLDAPRRP